MSVSSGTRDQIMTHLRFLFSSTKDDDYAILIGKDTNTHPGYYAVAVALNTPKREPWSSETPPTLLQSSRNYETPELALRALLELTSEAADTLLFFEKTAVYYDLAHDFAVHVSNSTDPNIASLAAETGSSQLIVNLVLANALRGEQNLGANSPLDSATKAVVEELLATARQSELDKEAKTLAVKIEEVKKHADGM